VNANLSAPKNSPNRETETATGFSRKIVGTLALILALTVGCYWPALHGSLVWDDEAHVTRPALRSLEGLGQIWSNLHATQQYYPLLHTAFWLEHRLWGDSTLGYHLVNVLLHAMAAGLLVLILRRINVPGAGVAGVLFAVHPVCVESVAWISEQKNTLSLVLYLFASLAYLRFDARRGTPAATRAYCAATLLFIMSLLSKSVTATLPAALIVVSWWRRGRLSWRRDMLPLLPWLLLSVASGLFTSWVERRVVGAEGAAFDLGLPQRFLLAGRIIWFYLGKLAWPSPLIFVYPRWDVPASAVGWTGYLAGVFAVTAVLWSMRRRMRGPLAAWLFFIGSLFPALGFFDVYPFLFSYVADHFQYLASLSVFAAVSAGAVTFLARASRPVGVSGWSVLSGLVAVLAFLSNAQSRTYASPPALYTATLDRNPDCWMAHNNLGAWYEGRNEPAKAIAEYRAAVRLNGSYADAHDNLGSVLLKMPGRLDEATEEFHEAVRLNPGSADYHDSLGNALANEPGRLADAISEYQAALHINPDFAEAHNNLGNAWMKMPGRLADAVSEYSWALRLNPASAEAHNNLGNALSAQGLKEQAVVRYREALRLMPTYEAVHFNIAMALLNVPGRRGEAESELQEYLRLSPGNETATRILAQIRAAGPQ
jgi:tetratricopeptide (TPR) repeat protein